MAAIPQAFERQTSAGKPPVTAHPAFPLVVGLWFAALLGLGSLVLPLGLLERLVEATGLAGMLPFLAAPLGFKAKAVIALCTAVIGAGLGLFAARRVAAAAPDAPRRRAVGAAHRRRPLNAHDDLGEDGFDAAPKVESGRRRALAIDHDERASEWLQVAPLPGQNRFETAETASEKAEPLDLGPMQELPATIDEAPAEPEINRPRQIFMPAPAQFEAPDDAACEVVAQPELEIEEEEPPMREEPRQIFRQVVTPVEPASPDMRQNFAPEPEALSVPVEELGLMQLVQRLGATLERHREWAARQAAAVHELPAASNLAAAQAVAPSGSYIPGDFGVADPGEAAQALGNFFAATPSAPEAPPQAPPLFRETSGDDAAATPEIRTFPGLGLLTEGMQDNGLSADPEEDDDDLGNLAASFSLPLRAVPNREATEEVGYSSHLTVPNPFHDPREQFVRIEEPETDSGTVEPAVVFPHEAPRVTSASSGPGTAARTNAARPFDPPASGFGGSAAPRPAMAGEDTAQALREALLNLQRAGKNG